MTFHRTTDVAAVAVVVEVDSVETAVVAADSVVEEVVASVAAVVVASAVVVAVDAAEVVVDLPPTPLYLQTKELSRATPALR